MADVGLGLSYWLPRTQLDVTVTKRETVATTPEGSFTQPVVDVQVVPTAVEDPSSLQTLSIDAGLLEKISLTITLDDRGFIQSVNGEAGRDISPVVGLIGKAVGLAGAVIAMGVVARPAPSSAPLEATWGTTHPILAARLAEIESRVGSMMDTLVDPNASAADIVQAGAAIDALQSQLALISRARRAWIADQATTVGQKTWALHPADLVLVGGAEALPDTLSDPAVPAQMAEMASDYGCLIAVIDPIRAASGQVATATLTDQVALRRCRPAQVGVYLQDESDQWVLERGSVRHLDVVDDFSPTDVLPLDGSWLRTKKFELSYHPDMSLKTFGLTTTSSVSAIATSAGDVLDSVSAARKAIAEKPSDAETQLEKAKTQLDLLKTGSEYEQLAATKDRAAEVAVLEQQKKIRDASV